MPRVRQGNKMVSDIKNSSNKKSEYDFILNQQEAGSPTPHEKKSNKKLIVVAVLLVLTFSMLIIAALFTANNNVQNEDNVVAVEIQTKREVVSNFIQRLRDGNIDGALQNLSTSLGMDSAKLQAQTDDFWGKLRLDTCKEESDAQVDEASIQYSCLHKSGDTIMIRFKIADEASGYKISDYNIWVFRGEVFNAEQ